MPDENNILKILVATDNHLGFKETDQTRGEDSFITFEEIFKHANRLDVDFVLLGGDLFHESNPSKDCIRKCISVLRRYTTGSKEIGFSIIREQPEQFASSMCGGANFSDPNINIAIPVFSIHGNHDDPSGVNQKSSLDLIATAGYVNYFGKIMDLKHIKVEPILINKGSTVLALYGLSYIRDIRLARMIATGNVELVRPDTDHEVFHILVLHQNRADRGRKNYLEESNLPDFIDLVIWGHEHECRIDVERVSSKDVYISQPGSSVATSLEKGESIEKHIGLLQICGDKFDLTPIKLETVRPFVFDTVFVDEVLADLNLTNELNKKKVIEKILGFMKNKIEEMLKEAEKQKTGDPNQPTLPLIRLRMIYTDDSVELNINPIRFSNQYEGRVANVDDMILITRKSKHEKKEENFDPEAFKNIVEDVEEMEEADVIGFIKKYYATVADENKLKLFTPDLVAELSDLMINKKDNNTADRAVGIIANEYLKYLDEHCSSNDQDKIMDSVAELRAKESYLLQTLQNNLDAPVVKSTNTLSMFLDDANSGSSGSETGSPQKQSKQARGRGRGRGTRARGKAK